MRIGVWSAVFPEKRGDAFDMRISPARRPAHGKGRMGATLDALHRLQSIENRLRIVREQIESRRRTVHARQRRIAKLEQEIADTHRAIQQTQIASDRLELDRKTREEHLAKLREALNRTKSNKEYAAFLTQLNTEKVDILKIEDHVLAALAKVDEEKKKIAATQASLDKEKAQLAEVAQTSSEAEMRLTAQLKELDEQRADAAAQIAPSVLALFERACERHEGEAMARLEQVHPKRAEFVCSGCSMSIPLEIINSLQSRDEVQQCQTCSRILYLDAPVGAVV